jgi:hypothetical protein
MHSCWAVVVRCRDTASVPHSTTNGMTQAARSRVTAYEYTVNYRCHMPKDVRFLVESPSHFIVGYSTIMMTANRHTVSRIIFNKKLRVRIMFPCERSAGKRRFASPRLTCPQSPLSRTNRLRQVPKLRMYGAILALLHYTSLTWFFITAGTTWHLLSYES